MEGELCRNMSLQCLLAFQVFKWDKEGLQVVEDEVNDSDDLCKVENDWIHRGEKVLWDES